MKKKKRRPLHKRLKSRWRRRKKARQKQSLQERLNKSMINYMSDLFIVVMVIAWMCIIVLISVVAVIVTFRNNDTSLWSILAEVVLAPLTAGGSIWLIKCSVQHAIAYSHGKRAHMDFPSVEGTEFVEYEQPMPEPGESTVEPEVVVDEPKPENYDEYVISDSGEGR